MFVEFLFVFFRFRGRNFDRVVVFWEILIINKFMGIFLVKFIFRISNIIFFYRGYLFIEDFVF